MKNKNNTTVLALGLFLFGCIVAYGLIQLVIEFLFNLL
jgi:hypothetical protein